MEYDKDRPVERVMSVRKQSSPLRLLERIEELVAEHARAEGKCMSQPNEDAWEDGAIAGQLECIARVIRGQREGKSEVLRCSQSWAPFNTTTGEGASLVLRHEPLEWGVVAPTFEPVELPAGWSELLRVFESVTEQAEHIGMHEKSSAVRAFAMMLRGVGEIARTYDRPRPAGVVLSTVHAFDRKLGVAHLALSLSGFELEDEEGARRRKALEALSESGADSSTKTEVSHAH